MSHTAVNKNNPTAQSMKSQEAQTKEKTPDIIYGDGEQLNVLYMLAQHQ